MPAEFQFRALYEHMTVHMQYRTIIYGFVPNIHHRELKVSSAREFMLLEVDSQTPYVRALLRRQASGVRATVGYAVWPVTGASRN